MLYTHAAAALASLAIGFTGGWWVQGWRLGEQIQTLKAQHASAAQAAEASAREKEHSASIALTNIEKEANDAKKSLSAQLAAARRELRDRPKRPVGGDVPQGSSNGMGCTGAGLHREDAQFLVGESARADQLRADLAACQARYDQAVKLTN